MVLKQGIDPCLSSLATSTTTRYPIYEYPIQNGIKKKVDYIQFIKLIVNLHLMLSNAQIKSKPTVLWCYKDKRHKKKYEQKIEKLWQKGLLDCDQANPFSLFLHNVKCCLYKNSESIMGNTYGMCILQDFEAITPNLLARTIETVEGGGLVILLLRSLSSLRSLYTTESHTEVIGRFNERFLLSLASCKSCLFLNDELNILLDSFHVRSIVPISIKEDFGGPSKAYLNLKNLQEKLNENLFIGPLVKKCCTLDQRKALVTFMDKILSRSHPTTTVALLAAPGRGKSATLGLSIAGAIAVGYSNIFVTAPSPKNLSTLFKFICEGLNLLDYEGRFDEVKSQNPEFKKDTIKINIYKHHRQTVQYISPHENEKLSQVDMLVVDEAASIPLPLVKSLLGQYLVFLSSTVNGYEGTGRSLSLKLLHQLAEQSIVSSKSTEDTGSGLTKIELNDPIRYASGDPIENWLSSLLCLDVSNIIPNLNRFPPCNECDLYYVNRDTLFSYHKDSETFLQRMMALYTASHYKNSPNDLQLMADAPAHHLFVLLGPVDESKNQLPDIFCAIQVCLEGKISSQSAIQSLSNGHQPFGDQIPWKFCEQFRETVFPSLSGARIVRIATHPSAMRLGYGSRAVELLIRYYEGQIAPISEIDDEGEVQATRLRVMEAAEKASLVKENIKPRADLPHLLVHLRERRPEKLLYIGASFGLTLPLFCFWSKLKFAPFYIGQISNAVTGEHSCMVLKALNNDEIKVDGSNERDFLGPFYQDFIQRFTRLLSSTFCRMEYKLAMRIIDPKVNFTEQESKKTTPGKLLGSVREYLSPHVMKRLEAYVNNLVDFHLILDLVPILAHMYFQEKLPVNLSHVQASVLLCIGLQNQNISYIQGQMKLERQQILSQILKIMKKFYKYLYGIEFKETEWRSKEIVMEPHVSLDEDHIAAKQVEDDMKSKAEAPAPFTLELLQQYVIDDGGSDFETELKDNGEKISTTGLISLVMSRKNGVKTVKNEKKRRKDNLNHKLSKRKRS
ncbi:RNA cytidine acetyltransferase 1 isoform X2 [Cajanus cajan]|uniref:RNA cytidine acetyltransferase 1 isoform X2 n=1 Tax=Cajanus cajan TaxID=3821 RepID=UPI0010FAED08|nr:RNA cytidine acetyltransferase 1 isoform X2 [Cajanus cajan]